MAIDTAGRAVIAAATGHRVRCPAGKLHRLPTAPAQPYCVAAEELIRDFHSVARPLTLR